MQLWRERSRKPSERLSARKGNIERWPMLCNGSLGSGTLMKGTGNLVSLG